MCNRPRCRHRGGATAHVAHGVRSSAEVPLPMTVSIRPTPRTIYIFQGAEFIDIPFFQSFLRDPAAMGRDWLNRTPHDDYLGRGAARVFRTLRGIPLEGSGETLTYSNPTQRLDYTLRFSGDRSLFKTALQTPDVGVFYWGHARYGRGPCFGPKGRPEDGNTGDFWNDGDGRTTGIFRMGWDFISVPASEIRDHGYKTDVADTLQYYRRIVPSHPAPIHILEERCDHDMRPYFRRIRDTHIQNIHPNVDHFVRNVDAPGQLHAHHAPDEDHPERSAHYLVLPAGAQHLRQTDVQCRFFAHMGCSTGPHNAWVFRETVGPVVDDKRHAAWTTNLAYNWGALFLVYHYLTYPQVAAGQPWGDQFRYAVDQANASLNQARSDWRLRRS